MANILIVDDDLGILRVFGLIIEQSEPLTWLTRSTA